MKTLTKAQVFQHMADNMRAGKMPTDRLQSSVGDGDWSEVRVSSPIVGFLTDDIEFRIKPRTHTLNGYDVPAPETEAPEVGVEYWVLMATSKAGVGSYSWAGDKQDQNALRNGLWLSEEDATANAKALRGENPYER